MGHHDDQRAVGRVGELGGGLGRVDQRDIGGRQRRKGLAPRIDPAHRERQRRERQRQRAPDMAGAEQIDGAGALRRRGSRPAVLHAAGSP